MTTFWKGLLLFTLVLAASNPLLAAILFARLSDESKARRSGTCASFELQHQTDIRNLRGVYTYLADLSSHQQQSATARAVVKQLPEIQKRALTNIVPPDCSEPGFGLDDSKLEPVPAEPPEVKALLRAQG